MKDAHAGWAAAFPEVKDFKTNPQSATKTVDAATNPGATSRDENFSTLTSTKSFVFTADGLGNTPRGYNVQHTWSVSTTFTTEPNRSGSGRATALAQFTLYTTSQTTYTTGTTVTDPLPNPPYNKIVAQSPGVNDFTHSAQVGLYCRAKAEVEVGTDPGHAEATSSASTTTTAIIVVGGAP